MVISSVVSGDSLLLSNAAQRTRHAHRAGAGQCRCPPCWPPSPSSRCCTDTLTVAVTTDDKQLLYRKVLSRSLLAPLPREFQATAVELVRHTGMVRVPTRSAARILYLLLQLACSTHFVYTAIVPLITSRDRFFPPLFCQLWRDISTKPTNLWRTPLQHHTPRNVYV